MSLDFAVSLPSQGTIGSAEQFELAKRGERAGYDLVFAAEAWGRETFTRLGYLASETDDVDLGTAIVPVHSRSPTLIAQTVATLDEISGGRAVLGLGVSSPNVIEDWHGVEFEPALRRQRETIEIIRMALSGDTVEYDGHVFDLDHFRLRFEPPRTDVPIYVAAQGETNIELTGGFADGWLPNRIPLSALPDVREHIDRGAEKQDRDPAEVATIPLVTTCVLEDGDLARQRCREVIAFYVGAMGSYHFDAVADHGYRETAEEIRRRWREEDDHEGAREAVSDELLAEITISGTPDEVGERIEAYEDVAEMVVTLPPTTTTYDEVQRTIDNLADVIRTF